MSPLLCRFLAAAVPLLFLLAPVLEGDPRSPLQRRRPSGERVSQGSTGSRVTRGLIAHYPFQRGEGSFAQDGSGFGGPMDLAFSEGVSWLDGRNGVRLGDGGKLEATSAAKLAQAVKQSGEFSFEAWVKADNVDQGGPARIVTYSNNPYERNFTLGVEGADAHIRLRTTDTNHNGGPDIVREDAASTNLEHYIVTSAEGITHFYRNGQLAHSEARAGDFSEWDESYGFAVGNEVGGNRAWAGEIYQVAVYSRALGRLEVRRNYESGSDPATASVENRPPEISTAGDQTVLLPTTSVRLLAAVEDEGLPNDTTLISWQQIAGPGTATFADAGDPSTTAAFSEAGSYRLALTANDGELTATREITVNVVATERVTAGLLAMYPLTEGSGEFAKDQSNNDPAVTLALSEEAEWLEGNNGVRLNRTAELRAADSKKIHAALTATNQFSFEAWVNPESVDQSQATIFTIAKGHYNSNFAVVQDREGVQVRLRTTESHDDGRPLLRVPGAFDGDATHIAATFDGVRLRIYVDGVEEASARRTGTLAAWDDTFPLRIGADSRESYSWAGDLYFVALYSRALSAPEVRRNFLVGGEIMGGGFPVANAEPEADGGYDRTTTLPRNTLTLIGRAIDDGLPGPGMSAEWSKLSGPGNVSFGAAGSLLTDATFDAPGDYVLELTVGDGQFTMRDSVSVRVIPEAYPRLLEQATWGPTKDGLDELMTLGVDGFLERQFAAEPSDFPTMEYGSTRALQEQFFYNALRNEDQLRQRMAFALSQILVVSANSVGRYDQMLNYERILIEHAFGNYLDLLREMTLSPTMGEFLDMVNNAAETPENLIPPNENYAREFLQLFSVGTDLLNADGTPQLGPDGVPLTTYDEEIVRQFTRAFTGWTYPTRPDRSLDFPNRRYFFGRMEPVEEFHDNTPKRLFGGVVLPSANTARQDLEAALRNAFEHPNLPPFISKQLIQHLVTSNPSPGYVERVATVFADNGEGVRGDLKAVATAILTDPEAQSSTPGGGHLREPILYTTVLMRNLGAEILRENDLSDAPADMGQVLFFPPSVFSYFSPHYRIPGKAVLGPEFQLHTKANALSRANFIDYLTEGFIGYGISLDLSRFEDLAEDPEQLVDAIDEALFQGRMTSKLRGAILSAAVGAEDDETRMRNALYVAATSSEYQVQH